MTAKLIGKESIQINMTLKQLESIFAALDSCADVAEHTQSKIYNNIGKTERALQTARYKAQSKQLIKERTCIGY